MAFRRTATDHAILAIGNNFVREKLMHQIDTVSFERTTVIHPLSIVSPSAVLGASSAVIARAIVGTEARLGVGAFLNCGVVVDHHATVDYSGHIGMNESMAGCTLKGCGAWIQLCASLGYWVKLAVWKVLLLETGRERCQTS